jgi:hypothetical protein
MYSFLRYAMGLLIAGMHVILSAYRILTAPKVNYAVLDQVETALFNQWRVWRGLRHQAILERRLQVSDIPWILYTSNLPPQGAVEAHKLVLEIVSENPPLPQTSPPSDPDKNNVQAYGRQSPAHTGLTLPAKPLQHPRRTCPYSFPN